MTSDVHSCGVNVVGVFEKSREIQSFTRMRSAKALPSGRFLSNFSQASRAVNQSNRPPLTFSDSFTHFEHFGAPFLKKIFLQQFGSERAKNLGLVLQSRSLKDSETPRYVAAI